MRAKGEGSIVKRADGKWMAALQVGGKRRFVYGASQAEVAAKLRDLTDAGRAGRLVEASKLTIAALLADWLAAVRPSIRPSTLESYQVLVRVHVVPEIGGVRLQALKPLHLVRLYADRAKTGISPRRVEMVHRVVRRALADAVKWRLLPGNPAADVQAPRPARPEMTVWPPDQTRTFLAFAQRFGRTYDPLWLVLIGAGVRRGEALGLRWTDVDLEARTIAVARSVGFVENRPLEGEPKTSAGRRAIHLPGFAVEALRAQRKRQAEWKLAAGADWPAGDRVFTSRTGATPTPGMVRTAFRQTCRAAGVPEVDFRDLQHVHATLAVRAGVDPKALQRRLGHASLAMTLAVYAHAVGDADRDAAAGLERVLTGRKAAGGRRR